MKSFRWGWKKEKTEKILHPELEITKRRETQNSGEFIKRDIKVREGNVRREGGKGHFRC